MPVPIQYRPAGAQKIGSAGKDTLDIGRQGRLADAKTFCWQALLKRCFKVRQAPSTRPSRFWLSVVPSALSLARRELPRMGREANPLPRSRRR
jgi:hypothetical protein